MPLNTVSKQIFEIGGKIFSTLEEFAKEFSNKLKLEITWNGNLDTFNDILYFDWIVEILTSEDHSDIELQLE